jgi:hypothetical protein
MNHFMLFSNLMGNNLLTSLNHYLLFIAWINEHFLLNNMTFFNFFLFISRLENDGNNNNDNAA